MPFDILNTTHLDRIVNVPGVNYVRDMKYQEFGYVNVKHLRILRVDESPSMTIRIDGDAPVFPHEANWQHKPEFIGIRRILDGYQINIGGATGAELVSAYQNRLEWVYTKAGAPMDRRFKHLLVESDTVVE